MSKGEYTYTYSVRVRLYLDVPDTDDIKMTTSSASLSFIVDAPDDRTARRMVEEHITQKGVTIDGDLTIEVG